MATAEASSCELLRPSIGPEKSSHTSRDTARGESGRQLEKKVSVEGGRRHYPQITIIMNYNGAEKGCGSIKKAVMVLMAAFSDGVDAYLAGGKEFSIIRHLYVENDRWACCLTIVRHSPKSPQQIRSYASHRTWFTHFIAPFFVPIVLVAPCG